MRMAFDWFLGANHLNQVIYNPCTGGCYDGLEENYVNLNPVSYTHLRAHETVLDLVCRLLLEKKKKKINKIKNKKK